jgi:integrase
MGLKMAEKQAQVVQKTTSFPNKIKIKKPRNRTPNRPLSREEVSKVMNAVDNLRDKTLLALAFNTGMRVSEPLTISRVAMDWDAGLLKIWDEKKNQYREVMPPRETLAQLRLFMNETKAGERPFPFTTKTAENIIQKWSTKALGRRLSFHAVRHTYISLSAEDKQDIKVVMMNTGDSAPTILKYYTQLSPEYRRKKTEEHPIYTEAQKGS